MTAEEARKQLASLKELRLRGVQLSASVEKAMKRVEAALLEHDFGAGASKTLTLKGNDAIRVLYKPGTQADKSLGWLVSCEKHGRTLSTPSKALGSTALSDRSWCRECSDELRGRR